jgi:hypothetical protein
MKLQMEPLSGSMLPPKSVNSAMMIFQIQNPMQARYDPGD